MPNAKTISSFPTEFAELASLASKLKRPVTIQVLDKTRANNFRGQWYSYIKALEREEGPNSLTVHQARSLSCGIRPASAGPGYEVVFTPRHLTDIAQLAQLATRAFHQAIAEEQAHARTPEEQAELDEMVALTLRHMQETGEDPYGLKDDPDAAPPMYTYTPQDPKS